MKPWKLSGLALCMISAVICSAFAEEDAAPRAAESRAVIKSFAGELQAALKSAMESGGPVKAIAVCNEKAPAIAAKHGEAKGWEVGRTSLKYRNPDNAPDQWEEAVLQRFDQRKAAGEDPAKMDFGEFTELDGKNVFRYMKAIPTAEVCLNCHGGDTVKPEVEARLGELYPDDKARGFSVGDIRGAFTIIQPTE
jgi:hypothetical protein